MCSDVLMNDYVGRGKETFTYIYKECKHYISLHPPCEQERACSTVKAWPQTHEAGRRGGVQQYRRWRASLNSLFESENPKSAKGRAVSQVDAPFSSAAITARFVFCGRRSLMEADWDSKRAALARRALMVAECWSEKTSAIGSSSS